MNFQILCITFRLCRHDIFNQANDDDIFSFNIIELNHAFKLTFGYVKFLPITPWFHTVGLCLSETSFMKSNNIIYIILLWLINSVQLSLEYLCKRDMSNLAFRRTAELITLFRLP